MNFFAGLILTQWNPSQQEAKHREAIRHYTQALYEIRNLEARGEWSNEDVWAVQDKYLDDANIPRIPSRYFLQLKQHYLRKAWISRYMERHPFSWLPWLKVRLWYADLRAGTVLEDDVDR